MLSRNALLAVILGGLAIMLLIATFAMQRRESPRAESRNGGTDDGRAVALKPEKRCASAQTYDHVKRELFRIAAQMRHSDQAAFDRLSAYSAARMERPLVRSYDDDLGTIRCSGTLFLDLPPGVQVVGGRRTLSADIDYILQPAADGSGDVVMLEGESGITIPLATLAQSQQGSELAEQTEVHPVQPRPPLEGGSGAKLQNDSLPSASVPRPTTSTESRAAAPAKVETPEPPANRSAANGRPSFNCRYARTRGEIAICRDGNLASLDREMASQYYRAVRSGDREQRQLLMSSRDQFLRRRDRCRSESCIADVYRARMREIHGIARQ